MKIQLFLIAVIAAALAWVAQPDTSRGAVEAYEVIATAYTCDAHPANPVYPCGRPRWGGNIQNPGMACPAAWRNRELEVPGYGIRRCDDTGAYDYFNGLPHIDVRVSSWAEARRFGVRRLTIYPAGAQPVVTPTPEPATTWKTPEGIIRMAHALAPKGDTETAMARLVYARRARKHFPTMMEGLEVGGGQPVWVVTLWVPPSTIPAGTQPLPDPGDHIAARFFLFDATSGELLTDTYVTSEVLDIMGWLPDDLIDLGR